MSVTVEDTTCESVPQKKVQLSVQMAIKSTNRSSNAHVRNRSRAFTGSMPRRNPCSYKSKIVCMNLLRFEDPVSTHSRTDMYALFSKNGKQFQVRTDMFTFPPESMACFTVHVPVLKRSTRR